MMGERRRSRIPLVSDGLEWSELDSFFPNWGEGMTLAQMRRWRNPLLCGSPRLTRHVAQNLRPR